jgi:DnaD/phage-associated family protein
MAYINKWIDEYKMEMDVILEACSRTIRSINKPSLAYTDGILSKWNMSGVTKFEDIKAADDAFAASKAAGKPASRPTKNKFKNFEERDSDMDALTKEILAKQKPI